MRGLRNAAIGITLGAFLGQLMLGRPFGPAVIVMVIAGLTASALVALRGAHS